MCNAQLCVSPRASERSFRDGAIRWHLVSLYFGGDCLEGQITGGGGWALSRKDILRIRTRSGIFVVSYCIGGG